ncbi:hypothetical protein D3C73_1318560 [compost metagenome]
MASASKSHTDFAGLQRQSRQHCIQQRGFPHTGLTREHADFPGQAGLDFISTEARQGACRDDPITDFAVNLSNESRHFAVFFFFSLIQQVFLRKAYQAFKSGMLNMDKKLVQQLQIEIRLPK